jgi:hypothetical protein
VKVILVSLLSSVPLAASRAAELGYPFDIQLHGLLLSRKPAMISQADYTNASNRAFEADARLGDEDECFDESEDLVFDT